MHVRPNDVIRKEGDIFGPKGISQIGEMITDVALALLAIFDTAGAWFDA